MRKTKIQSSIIRNPSGINQENHTNTDCVSQSDTEKQSTTGDQETDQIIDSAIENRREFHRKRAMKDWEEMLTSHLSEELAKEIDKQILSDLLNIKNLDSE